MKIVTLVLIVLVALGVGLQALIRLSPTDPATWHVAPAAQAPGDYPAANGFETVKDDVGQQALDALDRIAATAPRTRRIAGSPAEGMITWVSRSAFWGFPDYTTAMLADGRLTVYGRQRFGTSDWGVNRARIEAWMAALVAGTGGA